MGFSDMPSPTSTCSSLKRCRSEDPSSLADLYSPLPKQPFPNSPGHHLSLLYDLESSLNAPPAVEAAPTPEELVKEMMHSLEKVIGDIGELITASGDQHVGAATADSNVISVDNSSQACDLHTIGGLVTCNNGLNETPETLACSSRILSLYRDTGADCAESELAYGVCPSTLLENLSYSFDEYGRDMTSSCDVASVYECNGDVNEGDLCEREMRNGYGCSEGSARDGGDGIYSIQQLLDMSDGELGLVRAVAPTQIAEKRDEQWNLLDEFDAHDIIAPAVPSNMLDWLEEECDILAFSLSQMEEEGLMMGRESSGLPMLDCQ